MVARDIEIEIEFDADIRPVRGLNRDLSIRGNKAKFRLNQLYARQEKFVIVEVDVPAHRTGSKVGLASAQVGYRNLISKKKRRVQSKVGVTFSKSEKQILAKENREVMVAASQAQAVRERARAIALRDRGEIDKARKVLLGNSTALKRQARRYKSSKLKDFANKNKEDAQHLDKPSWNRQRKSMRKKNYEFDNNQSF